MMQFKNYHKELSCYEYSNKKISYDTILLRRFLVDDAPLALH